MKKKIINKSHFLKINLNNEDVKKLLKRKNKPAPKEIPVKAEQKAIEPASQEAEKIAGQVEVQIVAKDGANRNKIVKGPTTIPADMFQPAANRQNTITPKIDDLDSKRKAGANATIGNDEISVPKNRRQNQSEDTRNKYVTPIIPRPGPQINSTMNGFKKGMTGGKPQQLEARNGLSVPHSNKNKTSP